ncbi:MAG: GNAT family N-acetyltransferase [Clostridia bacterium]|nr:GNAT family N-acetyltransferase [Clostridia bacterium]
MDLTFSRFNLQSGNTRKAACLIYNTDIKLFRLMFGMPPKAINIIEKMICLQGNSFSSKNLYAVTDGNDMKAIVVSYDSSTEKDKKRTESKDIFLAAGFFRSLRLFFVTPIIDRIITRDLHNNDFYISNICVDEKCRGQGIGTFLLNKTIEMARQKGYSRVLLDVNAENIQAKRLYERMEFRPYGLRKSRYPGGEAAVYSMGLEL